jgi:hypothetical protein
MPSSPFYITHKQNTTAFESILSNSEGAQHEASPLFQSLVRIASPHIISKEFSSQILQQLRMMMFLTGIWSLHLYSHITISWPPA